MARKSTDIVPNMIRMREGLRRKLEQAATRNDQSLNSEMVARLEASFDAEGRIEELTDRDRESRAVGRALAGSDDNAKLLQMVSMAMQLLTVPMPKVPNPQNLADLGPAIAPKVSDRYEQLACAMFFLSAAIAGHPHKLYTLKEVDAWKDADGLPAENRRHGAFVAHTILKHYGFPGILDFPQNTDSMSLRDLTNAPDHAE